MKNSIQKPDKIVGKNYLDELITHLDNQGYFSSVTGYIGQTKSIEILVNMVRSNDKGETEMFAYLFPKSVKQDIDWDKTRLLLYSEDEKEKKQSKLEVTKDTNFARALFKNVKPKNYKLGLEYTI